MESPCGERPYAPNENDRTELPEGWIHPCARPTPNARLSTLSFDVEDKIAGVSCGCADAFGAAADAKASGFALLTDNPIPGTTGLPSLRNLTEQGYSILTF